MTEHEQPQHGGSYIRGEDGKLTRVNDSAPASAPITEAAVPDAKPARSPRNKDK